MRALLFELAALLLEDNRLVIVRLPITFLHSPDASAYIQNNTSKIDIPLLPARTGTTKFVTFPKTTKAASTSLYEKEVAKVFGVWLASLLIRAHQQKQRVQRSYRNDK